LSSNLVFKKEHPINIQPPLDIGYCAAVLEKNGYNVHIIDSIFKKNFYGTILNWKVRPSIVVIHLTTAAYEVAMKLARYFKEKYASKIIFMGQHASALPDTLVFKNSPVDICMIGEAEKTILDVCNSLSRNKKNFRKIRGIAFFDSERNSFVKTKPQRLIEDLDSLPYPKHEWFSNGLYRIYYPSASKKTKWGFIIATRGCPYKCIFCSPTLRVSYGKKFRKRTPRNVVDEMEYITNRFGVKSIFFLDDNFSFDQKWVLALCKEMKRRKLNVRWAAQIKLNHINREMLKEMKSSGCETLCFGVESGSDRILNILRKGITVREIKKSSSMINKEDMFTVCFFMIGCPTETMEEIEKTFKLALEIDSDLIQVAFFTPYPGSPIFEKFRKKFLFSRFSHYDTLIHNFSNVPSGRLMRAQKEFYWKYYARPSFILRHWKNLLRIGVMNEMELVRKTTRFLFEIQKTRS